MLRFSYDFSARTPLYDPDYPNKIRLLKGAGVEVIWLFGYFYGYWESSPEEIKKAKKILEDDGFEVGVINVPLGHGGNALDPNDPNINLEIGSGWQNRVSAKGQKLYNAACISDKTVADSVLAAETIREIGIQNIFYDDDLRLSSPDSKIQGCYCDDCIERFCREYNVKTTRAELAEAKDAALMSAWVTFQCGSLLRFLRAVNIDGIHSGIMVMHCGGRRHGIDIPRIRRELPDVFFRVGEGHFSDGEFNRTGALDAINASIHTHMALVGDEARCYSESTVFPAKALSPENLIRKIDNEIRAGLRNIYIMSGTWFITPEYWEALAKALPAFRELAKTLPPPKHEVMLTEPFK